MLSLRSVRTTAVLTLGFGRRPLPNAVHYFVGGGGASPYRHSSMASVATKPADVTAKATAAGHDFIKFVNEAVTPYHAVEQTTARLRDAGFAPLSEREVWAVVPNGKYYVVRNQSAVIAFAVGGSYVAGNGFTIAASHTDSPCLRVKPVSSLTKTGGYMSLGVETYGGGLWYSWLDRDLSLAGRVIVKGAGDGAPISSRLVRVRRPILRIPSLAIHLNRDVNTEGLKLNAENHLPPVLCTAVKAQLSGEAGGAAGAAPGTPAATVIPPGTGGASTRHHSPLVKLLAEELGLAAPEDVKDFDLCLYDTQPAAVGGLFNEFIYSGRLDNLMMMHTIFTGLVASCSVGAPNPLGSDPNVRLVAAFDHEEVGSNSVPGAASTFLEDTLRRLCPDPVAFAIAARKSVLVSADMAHAVHPNYR